MTAAAWETAAWGAGAVALVALLAIPVSCRLLAPRPGRGAAAPGTAPQRDATARLAEQDDLVQALVVASYALQLGDEDQARLAVDGALRQARTALDQLLAAAGHGALARQAAASTPASPAFAAEPPSAPGAPPAAGTADPPGPPGPPGPPTGRQPRWRRRRAGTPASGRQRHAA